MSNDMKTRVAWLKKSGELSGKAVYIFGHCSASEKLIDILLEEGICVSAILDNNAAKLGLEYRNVTIQPPEKMKAADAGHCAVLIAARAYESMAAQLRRIGFGGSIIKMTAADPFSEYSLSEDVLTRRLQIARRGADTLKKIRNNFPAAHLVICPFDAMGDVYQALSYLPAYCRNNGITQTAVIVTGSACAQTAALFQTETIVELDATDMDELVQAVIFRREDNCIIAHHDRPYTNCMIRYLNNGFLSFADFYKIGVYGLDKATPLAVPAGGLPYAHTHKLKKGKTMILSPYAKSVVNLPASYWADLAKVYKRDGYDVYTNVSGTEEPVRGTAPLSVPIREMISAAEYAGHFIGLRSGLCDILSTAKCKKTVVYPNCLYSTTQVKVADFFQMQGWESIVYKADSGRKDAQQ